MNCNWCKQDFEDYLVPTELGQQHNIKSSVCKKCREELT